MTDNLLSDYISVSKYARWLPDESRRETWEETVDRYIKYVVVDCLSGENGYHVLNEQERAQVEEIRQAILGLEVMPSMRMLMTAGAALQRDHMAGYNCSFVAIDHPRALDEILYILTCGTGVGFSVEQQFIKQLPEVAEELHETDTTIVVADSRIGWASAFRELLSLLWSGKIPRIDVSRVRGKGERLKTFGGRASGPEPLVELFDFSVRLFKSAVGRKLTDLEVHDLVCKIGEIVVVGGVRRSALISLSDLTSARMRDAKSGKWPVHRNLANNSAVFESKPTTGEFLDEWTSLYKSKSGERGIYYRKGIRDKIARGDFRDASAIVGTNPCSEIALRSGGLCNLSEVVVRPDDTVEDLRRKIRIATIIGTIQSTFTDFRYVRNIWKRNAEEERLLGVSLTGIYDHPHLSGVVRPNELASTLEGLREYAREVNAEWADRFGINQAASITCVKPSGTVSQRVDSASGIHPRHAAFYLRSVRQDNKDPLTQLMKDAGVPSEPDITKPNDTTVFSFPMKAPTGSLTRADVSPLQHLELWKLYNEHWAEHQVSITVSVKEDEWLKVGAWVFDNFDSLSGVSFLPMDGGTYRQAPYQDLTEQQYEEWQARMPTEIDWTQLSRYEVEDTTTSAREFACVGSSCEVQW